MGTETLTSVAYAVSACGAILAAFYTLWWLVITWSIVGGAAHALSGRRWLRAYRSAPAAHARGESLAWLALGTISALAGLAFLLLNH